MHEICSLLEVFYEKGVQKNFLKFTGKHKEQSSRGVPSKKVFLKIFQNSEKGTCARVPFLKKLQAENLKRDSTTLVFL